MKISVIITKIKKYKLYVLPIIVLLILLITVKFILPENFLSLEKSKNLDYQFINKITEENINDNKQQAKNTSPQIVPAPILHAGGKFFIKLGPDQETTLMQFPKDVTTPYCYDNGNFIILPEIGSAIYHRAGETINWPACPFKIRANGSPVSIQLEM